MLCRILKKISENSLEDGESEAMRINYIVTYKDGKIIVNRCETFYSNEYNFGAHEPIETVSHGHCFFEEEATIEDYVNLLVEYINEKRYYADAYYGKRVVNSLSFTYLWRD